MIDLLIAPTWWWRGLVFLVACGSAVGAYAWRRRVRAQYLRALDAESAQRRQAEAALRESELRYRGVVEDQTLMICRLRADGTYTFVNREYGRYFNRRPEELVGASIWQSLPASEHEAARSILGSITPDHPVTEVDHQVVTPDGETRWHHWADRGLFDKEGRLVEYQCVGVDVTDRMQAEKEHRQLVALRIVDQALRRADRQKNDFLAVLAHELRNPLAPVAVAAELLRSSPLDHRRAAWARDVIARQVKQIMRLVDDLLDVSRITRGKILLRKEAVDLRVVAAQAVEAVRPLLDQRGQELSVSLPDAPLHVDGDPARLAQIVSNLLTNATKFSARGAHIDLEVRRERADGAEATILVRDTGVGIPPEMLARIFEPFTQIEGMREHAEGGLGIGLTLVKRLAEMHGGMVRATSAGPGLGSEFRVQLPALSSPRLAGASEDGARAEPGTAPQAVRVLVVDNNADAADTLGELLTLWGHTVRVVYDGLEALEAAHRFAPDVVLLDLCLPKLDGLEVAQRLRAASDSSAPMLVAFTGRTRLVDRRRCVEAGFADVVIKPAEPERLRDLLAHVQARAPGPVRPDLP
jgi:PAS domain S-box-containing protein